MILETWLNFPSFLEVMLLGLAMMFFRQKMRKRGCAIRSNDGSKTVPVVSGSWPYFGHIVHFVLNPHKFLTRCYKECGDVFTIQLGFRKVIMMCDSSLLNEYFSHNETQTSFYQSIASTRLDACFSDTFTNSILITKEFALHAYQSRISEVMTKLNDKIGPILKGYKESLQNQTSTLCNDHFLLTTLHTAFFRVFFGFDITPEMISTFKRFSTRCLHVVLSTYILPDFLVRSIFLRRVRATRNEYIKILLPHLKKYIQDPSLNDSVILRSAVDFIPKCEGMRMLSPEEKCSVLLGSHFALVTTPLYLCAQVLKEVSNRPDLWNQIRAEVNPKNVTVFETIRNELLDAVVMEGARLNTNIIAGTRKTFPHSRLGAWNVSNTNSLAVVGCLLLERSEGECPFDITNKFNPERFLQDRTLKNPSVFWLWGVGMHSCTGRNISKNIIKIFLAQFAQHFDFEICAVGKMNYFSFSIIPDQPMTIKLKPVRFN